ncbi:MAG: hypothetical protein GY874_04140 [Desulfobacteraceae bacterium]|nr:hypothetical protein [Desulfobacteraceae bacterium]
MVQQLTLLVANALHRAGAPVFAQTLKKNLAKTFSQLGKKNQISAELKLPSILNFYGSRAAQAMLAAPLAQADTGLSLSLPLYLLNACRKAWSL